MFLIQGLRVLNSNYITQSKNSSDVIIIKPGRIRYLFVGPSKRKPTNKPPQTPKLFVEPNKFFNFRIPGKSVEW